MNLWIIENVNVKLYTPIKKDKVSYSNQSNFHLISQISESFFSIVRHENHILIFALTW